MDEEDRTGKGHFKPGQSGNPHGRPRKERSVGKAILKAASATVTATENGKRRRIRKLDATAAQLANKGASGDIRAGKMLLDMAARAEAEQHAAEPLDVLLTPNDREIVDRFLAQYRAHLEDQRP